MAYWKRVSTTKLFSHPRHTVVEDSVILPDGTATKYLRFENELNYSTVISQRNDQVALIREYSYPLDEFLWQFSEGSIEAGEDVLVCAQRELKEEAAGLDSANYTEIGRSPSHHRRSTVWQYVVIASDVYDVQKIGGDETEQGTELAWFTVAEIDEMIAESTMVQKNALAAWSIYKAVSVKSLRG